MANRAETLDSLVFTIDDLKREGSSRMTRMYRDYFNDGAMAMETCVSAHTVMLQIPF